MKQYYRCIKTNILGYKKNEIYSGITNDGDNVKIGDMKGWYGKLIIYDLFEDYTNERRKKIITELIG